MLVFTVGSALVFLALGMTFGSFLNVLVFRWPRGLPVSRVRSRCPGCGIPIPKRDNVPVLGYLRLGGRCQCGESRISARYPLVEAICGAMALGLFLLELHGGGMNLPVYGPRDRVHLVWTAWYERPDLLAAWALHFALVYVLFGMALVQYDGHAVPGRLWGAGMVVCAGIMVWEPRAHVVPFALERAVSGVWRPPAPWDASAHGLLAANVGLGLAAGAAAGAVVRWIGRRGGNRRESAAVFWAFLLVGLVLGWHGVIAVLMVGGLLSLVRTALGWMRPRLGSWPDTGLIWLAVLGLILCWRWLWEWPFWPEVTHPERALLASGMGLAGWMLGAWMRRPGIVWDPGPDVAEPPWRSLLPFPPREEAKQRCTRECRDACGSGGVDSWGVGRS